MKNTYKLMDVSVSLTNPTSNSASRNLMMTIQKDATYTLQGYLVSLGNTL